MRHRPQEADSVRHGFGDKSLSGLLRAGLLVAGIVWSLSEVFAGDVRTMQGKIVAVNLAATPPVIVVESKVSQGDPFVVGASVGPATDISRGARKVRLEDLKVGETVIISFGRTEQGHAARAIHAK
jgi:hypothetical protein